MTLRVACLGAGYFSRFHIDGWQRIKGVELAGVCDLDPAKAGATGVPPYADLTKMLQEVAPDILDIILPPAGHAAAIKTAVGAGVPTVICQKPFCTSLSEAREMVALAKAAGTNLVIHENFRFQPWYRTIKLAIDNGQIGQVLQATFRLRPGDGQGPDAYLDRQPYFREMPRLLIHETGVHFVDVFRYLLGDVTSVYADLRQVNPVLAGEDAGHVISTHCSGARAVFDANRCLDHATDNTRRTMGEALIEGTEGTLTLTGDGVVRMRVFGKTEQSVLLGPNASQHFGGDCTFTLQEHVVEALHGKRQFENLAADYVQVLVVEKAIYRSAETGQKVLIT